MITMPRKIKLGHHRKDIRCIRGKSSLGDDAVGPLDQANKNCGGFAHQRGGFAEEENLHLVAGFG